MCVVSMVSDHYGQKFISTFPNLNTSQPGWVEHNNLLQMLQAQKVDIEALRAEVLNMRELLQKAKIYDTVMGEPECEKDEKTEIVKRVAEALGVDLGDVFK